MNRLYFIALLGLILCSLVVHGLKTETRFKDKIDLIIDVLETGSDSDRNNVLTTNHSEISWQVVLEQCVLQKKDEALTAILNYPQFIDWSSGYSSEFLMSARAFGSTLQQLQADGNILWLNIEAFLFDFSNQGKIITGFVVNHEAEFDTLKKEIAADISDFILYWMVSVNSADDVQNILNHDLLLNSVSEKVFEQLIGLCILENKLDIFKVFMENPNSLQRVKKHSKSIWASVFPHILDYKMNLVQMRNRRPSQLLTYILSSTDIMEMIDSKIVNSIFVAAYSSYENLNLISSNDEAMKKVHLTRFGMARFSKKITRDLKRDIMNEATIRLWLTKSELSIFLTPQILGFIFVESATKNWMDVIEIILGRNELLDKIDSGLLNEGILINTDEHLEVIGAKLTISSNLLEKLENTSVGLLFSRILALQHESIINAFLEREELMSLVPPEYLAKGLDELIVEDVESHTERILGLFLNDKYIARITDENWLTIVKHSVRYNKKQVLDLLFQHDPIIRRLPTSFLKRIKRYVNQDKKEAIKKILNERDPETLFSGIQKSIDRLKDRRVRPKNMFSIPILTADQIAEQFKEMQDIIKDLTKDGHILTPAEQETIMQSVMDHWAPNLPSLMP